MLAVPLPGAPAAGGGGSPRADGAARPLNGCPDGSAAAAAGGGCGTCPSGRAPPSSGCSAGPAPRAVPAGTSRNPPAGVAVPVPLPGCGTCRIRRLWQITAGQHLPVGASFGVRSQFPALWVRVAALWEGCALLGALGTADAGEKKINKQHLFGVVKGLACFFLCVRLFCFYFACSRKSNVKENIFKS